MHEAGLMQTALDLAAAHARSAGATRIHRICLRVGELSGVVPEALEFAFQALSAGGPAEGAVLEIERVPASTSDPLDPLDPCAPADGSRVGRELELCALEIS